MANINLRESLNAISDVVNNRPQPLRIFDQIFMKTADMLLQCEHIGRWFDGKDVVFIGDGDAIGLCLVHLHQNEMLSNGPRKVKILDFDERVVLSVQRFAERFSLQDRVSSSLYNVADPLPQEYWQAYQGFYTNPPFGASNEGKSVEAFVRRGIEATGKESIGCLVIADHVDYSWTQDVLMAAQSNVIDNGFVVAEMLPQSHHYHLDDNPELTSCSMIVRNVRKESDVYSSQGLTQDEMENFYGKESPLKIRYIKDNTCGGKFPSRDYEVEAIGNNHD